MPLGPGADPWFPWKAACVEEAAEVVGGINILEQTGNARELKRRAGRPALQVVMHAQIAKEEGLFTLEDVMRGITDKMIPPAPACVWYHSGFRLG